MQRFSDRNQQFALLSAGIYLSAGVAGFVVTGFDGFTANTTKNLLFLGINPLHNVVHLTLGVAWLLASLAPRTARPANIALGIGLLAAFVLGVSGGAKFLNIDNATEPDNYLHLLYGLGSLLVAAKFVTSTVAHTTQNPKSIVGANT